MMPAASIAHDSSAPITPARPVRNSLAATIATTDGRFVTGGVADIEFSEAKWRATVRQLDRPGMVASMYFSEGTRAVIVRFEDGRRARARIAGTSFNAGRERVCELTGVEPLV